VAREGLIEWRRAPTTCRGVGVVPRRGAAQLPEGMPRTLLEAAIVRAPARRTDVPAAATWSRRRQRLLVPLHDAPALAGAIARLSGDALLRARMGARAARW